MGPFGKRPTRFLILALALMGFPGSQREKVPEKAMKHKGAVGGRDNKKRLVTSQAHLFTNNEHKDVVVSAVFY